MIGDDLCAVSWRARPGSFVGLMTLYESNYIRLGWLAGDLRTLAGEQRSRVADDCELRLAVGERGPYTTTFVLTYLFPDGAPSATFPDMTIRVYHDARVAEAQGLGDAAAPGGEDLGRRWARNMMLNKWLEYCAERGHRFGHAHGMAAPP